MSKFNRKKIAVALAFAALFGNKTSAMNSNKNQVKNPQTLAAVGGAASNINSAKIEKSWPAWVKILIGAGIIGEGYNEVAGIISGKSLVTGRVSFSRALIKAFSSEQQDDEQMTPDDKSNEKLKKEENINVYEKLKSEISRRVNSVIGNENWQKIEAALSENNVGLDILCHQANKSFRDVVFELANQLVNDYENAKSRFAEKIGSAYRGMVYFSKKKNNLQEFKNQHFDDYLKELANIFSGETKVESVVCLHTEATGENYEFVLEFSIENGRFLKLDIDKCKKKFKWSYEFGSKLGKKAGGNDSIFFNYTDLWDKS